jgi:nicotinate-nucleotide pyrophosphorylase (carboxylating)
MNRFSEERRDGGGMVPLRYLLSFLEEDAPFGDITSEAVVPDTECEARIIARQSGIIAGLEEAARLFSYSGANVETGFQDGSQVGQSDELIHLRGSARSILFVERTALNIIGRMSGIATKTRFFVTLLASSDLCCRIAATRKTCPGFRVLDKKAVLIGGGEPHRFSLSDGILIKDNHLALVSVPDAIMAAKRYSRYRMVEVEVEDTAGAIMAARAGADSIMLDNMTPGEIASTVAALERMDLRTGRLIEVSGSIDESNIRDYALPGVDVISIGSITHSVRSFDVSLDIIPPGS